METRYFYHPQSSTFTRLRSTPEGIIVDQIRCNTFGVYFLDGWGSTAQGIEEESDAWLLCH